MALVGGGALLVAALTAGQTIGGYTRARGAVAPRGRSYGTGPNDFQINRTAVAAAASTPPSPVPGGGYTARRPDPVMLDRAALEAMPQHTVELPIACVEGWSTTQTWTGVRLRRSGRGRRAPAPGSALVSSLERFGAFNHAVLQANQVLTPTHCWRCGSTAPTCHWITGIPARIIVPALPGVHNTKWVSTIEFRET